MNFFRKCLFYFWGDKDPKKGTHSSKQNSSFVQMERFNQRGEILIHKKIETTKEFNEVIEYTSKNTITHQELINAILLNIRFLERLLRKLEHSIYLIEFNKVSEMLEQSKTSKSLLENISNSKVFYQNTIETIKRHTLSIAKLVRKINELDNDGNF